MDANKLQQSSTTKGTYAVTGSNPETTERLTRIAMLRQLIKNALKK